MKTQHLVNLNTAIDLIWELRSSGKIDREIESVFIETLYKAGEFRLKKNPYKILEPGESELVWDIKNYIDVKIESLKKLYLKIEATGDRFPRVIAADKIDKTIKTYLDYELGKLSAAALKIRETFIELSNCTDNSERLEIIKQRLNSL